MRAANDATVCLGFPWAMVFGRCFEKALAALFRREDPGATLSQALKSGASSEMPLWSTENANPGTV